ncbi:MAG: hypothetical protein A3J93_02995 [Candidatus Magasanikbacteria bacterium RIFOXYC2_FULL_42_28]|uniref:Baseplate protein J-like domain-containing protein n=1 Tax=Candidatus Magasanikbacteria bacterium RIFOXYC2_FULL_42_28 TaxID=1798704 RepID=A0A1F6NV10_9BACT|nr:MAG: hypothetical protein A3J93_02995 [Candidatus Magasanikbacteria bacterium RIFOXYC2_FULL_42_28]
MIVRHSETRTHFEPSVKFYRTIALSFLFITIVLLGLIIFITSKKASIVILAKEDAKTANLSINVGAGGTVGAIKGVVTTSIFTGSEKFYPTTFDSSESVATGEVIIYNKSNVDQALVKTTRFLTPEQVMFRLSERVNVPAGGQVIAPVYADRAGASSEIGPAPFIIPGLSEDRQKFIYAESKSAMTGGVKKNGVLTATDLATAEKSYQEKVKQKFVSQAVAPAEGMSLVVVVLSTNATADHKVGDTIAEFVLSGESRVVAVWYETSALKEMVAREIGSQVDLELEKVVTVSGEPQITLSAQDVDAGTAQLSVSQEARVTLDSDGSKVAPRQFLDKTKEEIERYLLGLGHVSAVDVKFSPSWMRKSPSVPDNIKVVVKQVK